jgi:hypothetical protein
LLEKPPRSKICGGVFLEENVPLDAENVPLDVENVPLKKRKTNKRQYIPIDIKKYIW